MKNLGLLSPYSSGLTCREKLGTELKFVWIRRLNVFRKLPATQLQWCWDHVGMNRRQATSVRGWTRTDSWPAASIRSCLPWLYSTVLHLQTPLHTAYWHQQNLHSFLFGFLQNLKIYKRWLRFWRKRHEIPPLLGRRTSVREKNETPLTRVWKPPTSWEFFKILREAWEGKAQRE